MDIKKRSNAQRLRDALEDGIINGRRPRVNAWIRRRGVASSGCREFGVSRTPVREAVQQLVASGLVTVSPKKGTCVAQVGIDELIEMFEVMANFEGMCGRLAARRICSSLDEHREILAAIEHGDAERAERLLREHVVIQGERFSDFVSSGRRFGAQLDAV
ncbi:GntR family transcriptional regulator [Halomonas ventosae]|nr:GntR family transcriptional regulator [Halomonas ventosae]